MRHRAREGPTKTAARCGAAAVGRPAVVVGRLVAVGEVCGFRLIPRGTIEVSRPRGFSSSRRVERDRRWSCLRAGSISTGPVVPDTGQPCGEWPVSGPTGCQGDIIPLGIYCPTRIDYITYCITCIVHIHMSMEFVLECYPYCIWNTWFLGVQC